MDGRGVRRDQEFVQNMLPARQNPKAGGGGESNGQEQGTERDNMEAKACNDKVQSMLAQAAREKEKKVMPDKNFVIKRPSPINYCNKR